MAVRSNAPDICASLGKSKNQLIYSIDNKLIPPGNVSSPQPQSVKKP